MQEPRDGEHCCNDVRAAKGVDPADVIGVLFLFGEGGGEGEWLKVQDLGSIGPRGSCIIVDIWGSGLGSGFRVLGQRGFVS